jgi:hypothetical protein
MELECVFFSVTPTAVRASRMDLLLTSNSRARSLMRTLLIYPFVGAGGLPLGPVQFHCALSCSYQPQSKVEFVQSYYPLKLLTYQPFGWYFQKTGETQCND